MGTATTATTTTNPEATWPWPHVPLAVRHFCRDASCRSLQKIQICSRSYSEFFGQLPALHRYPGFLCLCRDPCLCLQSQAFNFPMGQGAKEPLEPTHVVVETRFPWVLVFWCRVVNESAEAIIPLATLDINPKRVACPPFFSFFCLSFYS